MRPTTSACFILLATSLSAQPIAPKGDRAGLISVGGRSSFSFFNDGASGRPGQGIGGQFRIQLSDRVNTDWFYDYLTAPVSWFAHRQDQHIGWSVLFYLSDPGEKPSLVQPYVLAGHCFDYSRFTANADPGNFGERWSSAVQAGLGTHFNLTDRADVSLVGQYMIHLGTHMEAEVVSQSWEVDPTVQFITEKGSSLEGHLLVHLSFNYKLFDAW